jgi:hypothetical protein
VPLPLGGYPCFDDGIVGEFFEGIPGSVVVAEFGNVVGVKPLRLPLVPVQGLVFRV